MYSIWLISDKFLTHSLTQPFTTLHVSLWMNLKENKAVGPHFPVYLLGLGLFELTYGTKVLNHLPICSATLSTDLNLLNKLPNLLVFMPLIV